MAFSYLIISVLVTIVGIIALALRPNQRPFILLSGLYAAPAGLGDVLFVPEYWAPLHVVAPWFSVEGILFSFGNGCLIALLVTLAKPKANFSNLPSFQVHWWRFFWIMIVGVLIFLVSWQQALGKLMIMHAAFIGFLIMAILLWISGHFQFKLAMVGGLGFAFIYFIETVVWAILDPEFTNFWIAAPEYLGEGHIMMGLPIEEYLWAGSYGALWSCLMGYIIDPKAPTPWSRIMIMSRGKQPETRPDRVV